MPFDFIGKVEMTGELTVNGTCLTCGKVAPLDVEHNCKACYEAKNGIVPC